MNLMFHQGSTADWIPFLGKKHPGIPQGVAADLSVAQKRANQEPVAIDPQGKI